jgi:hypothetical protein
MDKRVFNVEFAPYNPETIAQKFEEFKTRDSIRFYGTKHLMQHFVVLAEDFGYFNLVHPEGYMFSFMYTTHPPVVFNDQLINMMIEKAATIMNEYMREEYYS